jgi:hypothetical protein
MLLAAGFLMFNVWQHIGFPPSIGSQSFINVINKAFSPDPTEIRRAARRRS